MNEHPQPHPFHGGHCACPHACCIRQHDGRCVCDECVCQTSYPVVALAHAVSGQARAS